ncbi:hypothetical protein HPB51_009058 [Rhipicephalus microplus]|uniref:Uncharacterized protein n=1 Tax=Rhipicephalus microplus TaxID=6941 RepID=A0A9J6D956_RHIMP|nr:hypothetical protein HPB51_009058 [Rhipicephalus microplus]
MLENTPRLRECRELLTQLETLCASVYDGDREVSTLSNITVVCNLLKELGGNMDIYFEAKLDWCYGVFCNVSGADELSVVERLSILEVIDVRSMGWKEDRAVKKYYNCKYEKLCAQSAENNDVSLEQPPGVRDQPGAEKRAASSSGNWQIRKRDCNSNSQRDNCRSRRTSENTVVTS